MDLKEFLYVWGMGKGTLEMLQEQPSVSYDPKRGITLDELGEMMIALSNAPKRKPEYLLSLYEAETLPLWQLTWLGENYIVLCSVVTSEVISKRFSEAEKQV